MTEKRKLTLSEIMARPLPEPDPETEAQLALLEELFDPKKPSDSKNDANTTPKAK